MKIDPHDPEHLAAVLVFLWCLFVCCVLGLLFAHCHPIVVR